MRRTSSRCHGCGAALAVSKEAQIRKNAVRCHVCGRDVAWEQYQERAVPAWSSGFRYPNPHDVEESTAAHELAEPVHRPAEPDSHQIDKAPNWLLAGTMVLVVASGLLSLVIWLGVRWLDRRDRENQRIELRHPRATLIGGMLLSLQVTYECPERRHPDGTKFFVVLESPLQRYEAVVPRLQWAHAGTLAVTIPVQLRDRGPFTVFLEATRPGAPNAPRRSRASNTVQVLPLNPHRPPRLPVDPPNRVLPQIRPPRDAAPGAQPGAVGPWARRPVLVS
jgi:hypothetical protein